MSLSAFSASCAPAGTSSAFPYWNLIIIGIVGLILIGLGLFHKKAKKNRKNWKILYLTTGIILLFWVGFRLFEDYQFSRVHLHANFKVFIDGKEVDFAKPEFMTESKQDHSKKVHLHDLRGDVVHVHYSGVTWSDFFDSLGFRLTKDCLDLGKEGKYCNTDQKKLRFFINDKEIENLASVEIQDLDRVLIHYGQGDLTTELASVKDDACLYSNKCQERGIPKGIEVNGLGCAVS